MNISESECSSGCESGWTLYLEQSCYTPNGSHKPSHEFLGNNKNNNNSGIKQKKKGMLMEEEDYEEEEEEDLSMVSDASSGPPHFHHEEDEEMLWFYNTKSHNFGKRQKMKDQFNGDDQDDTASSPLFNYSNMGFTSLMDNNNNNNNQGSFMDYSQGFSATHFQRKTPAFQDTYGFLQSSLSRSNQPHEMMSDLREVRRRN